MSSAEWMMGRGCTSSSVRQPLIDSGGGGGPREEMTMTAGRSSRSRSSSTASDDDFPPICDLTTNTTTAAATTTREREYRRRSRRLSLLNERQSATAASIYTIFVCLATFFGYCFLLVGTTYQTHQLADVYLGVQASYAAVLLAELTALCLTVTLMVAGIYQENSSLVAPWVLGFIGSMALEALSIVYSNILREQITQNFDQLCYFEAGVFVAKTLVNIFVIAAVVRFYRQLKNGRTWRINDVYEL